MFPMSETNRLIDSFSAAELNLQKANFYKPSIKAIIQIKQVLADLFDEGIFVHRIINYEQSPNVKFFPDSMGLRTGRTIHAKNLQVEKRLMNLTWDFWRYEVFQHVIESETI